MRYALFDNSTLTAIQRILGGIPLRNMYIIDSDILALETYIQAILFYDKLVYLDDYKEYFRESRKAFFPDMHAYRPSTGVHNHLLEKAKEICDGIVPRVEAGQLTDDDFRPFFELLKMNVIFTWDMTNSTYWLTVKMLESIGGLDTNKYSKLATMIKQELTDQSISSTEIEDQEPLLYNSKGEKVTFNKDFNGLASETVAFFAGLNWLAFRTFFYTLAANELGMDLFLHHIRHSFQINSFQKLRILDDSTYKPLIDTLNSKASDAINKIFSPTRPFIVKQNLPMFTAWLAKETGDPHQFVKAAYELRKSAMFVQARQQLIELEETISQNDTVSFLQKANKIVKDVERQMQAICAKYKVNTPQGIALSPAVSIWNLSTMITQLPQIPEINADLGYLDFIQKLHPPKGFKGVYRALLSDLTRIERLGEFHDIITSRIIFHDEAAYHGSKIEPRRYYGKESYWKKLM
jgi:hypothetical protein